MARVRFQLKQPSSRWSTSPSSRAPLARRSSPSSLASSSTPVERWVAPSSRTYVRHVLPNALPPILVQATLSISTAILAEAALSFLGVGTRPPAPSWGGMLSESRAFMDVAPWTAVFPGMAIMLAILAFNLLGDGIRDYLDPRLRNL